jgi:hypothetical protein
MEYGVLADAVVLVHFGFIVFASLGGLLVVRWPRTAWLHVPAAAWGAFIALSGGICPLTPLENRLRAAAGRGVYEGSFIDRYVLPVLYPAGLTADQQAGFGALLIAVNLGIYAFVWRRRAGHRA